MRRFEAIRLNWWLIMRRTKAFNFFALGFTNFAIFVSLIVGAPDYFAGTISLGVLMLINSSFGNVQAAFSWFVSSYQQIVTWRATVQRLAGFERAVRAAGTCGVVTYPRCQAEVTDECVRQAVADVGLARLADHLADIENWTLRLSGGRAAAPRTCPSAGHEARLALPG
jgi:putative ATP-binding cassette transporter